MPTPTVEPESSVEVTFSESVCSINNSINFTDFNTETILNQISINGLGTYGRHVAYFGSRPYSYGHIHHEPCDYPDNDIFNTISTRMKTIDSNFSYDDWTCLVTYYPDGRASIPRHCDNEKSIVEDSTIYTISVG